MARQDLEQALMRRLVDGLAGWATYYQACGAGRHYDEHLFYQHIDAIAKGRDWKARQQHPLAGVSAGPGAPSTVDFVLYRPPGQLASRAGLVFLEVKYLRGHNPSQDLANLRKDIEKLRSLRASDLVDNKMISKCGAPAKFILIIAQAAGLQATIKVKSKPHAGVVEMLRKAHEDPADTVYWATCESYLKAGLHWHVIAIGSARWPR